MDASQRFAKQFSSEAVKTYDSDIFVGMAVGAPGHNIEALRMANLDIINVWPSHLVSMSRGSAVHAVDSSILQSLSTLTTPCTLLHASRTSLGIFGKGAVIAIIDNGVDYNHPAVGFVPGSNDARGIIDANMIA